MAKKYTGSLSLDWFNKQRSILVQAEESGHKNGDVSAPKMNWINKDEALLMTRAEACRHIGLTAAISA